MAKKRVRICTSCAIKEETFSKSPKCGACISADKKVEKIEAERQHLSILGYKLVAKPIEYKNGHRHYYLTTSCCSREVFMSYPNILKQLKLIGKPPCTYCGGSHRMAGAMAGYVEKYGRQYDLEEFREYSLAVRRKSERTYRLFKDVINPENYKRGHGKNDWHLDHRTSIIFCFKNGISADQCASLQNLQLLPAKQNLQKGRNSDTNTCDLIPDSIKALVELGGIKVVSDFENVFCYGEEVVVRHAEIKNSLTAVESRLKYLHNKVEKKLGARNLEIKEVSVDLQKLFLSKWHVQGYTSCSYAVGLWLGDELVSLMTFGVPRYKQKSDAVELIRFCSHGELIVSGAASKLFKHAVDKLKPAMIVSYSLNRWGTGRLYETLGFTKKGEAAAPRFFWFHDKKIRSWRASVLYSKRHGIPLQDTVKIADPGTTTWVYC